ncbi:MAG TPA: F0F1 ATP synthase subunit A [Brevefilum fermentans]|jgi:F-type H+-transporting ATPase subunit a|uniref:ATP synthase subunit a n=1 Tax=Candidatus Brevifilum fermentans TaxID=1986204 RepID=A0A1Y6K926_9CHLR|nr:F0F1 ATP synthase subunit A [Brevefilum fermentans]MDI9566792.1 F0F1 ATP synthase subunit A [Chloroflexota bacterium]SMX54530.1 ATP synthase subunit a 2 [Brevefilum fermentans]HQA29134.1 F0F1 ATP synthase subunit A [Brevefilum fermentans]
MDSITPQVVFEIYGIKITNTVVSTWVIMVILILLAWVIRRFKPGIGEVIIESINGIIGSVMPEETGTIKYLPILGTLAVFLIFSNLFGLVPGMVSPTANINTTFALALIVFFAVHVYGIAEKGLWGYIKDFANPIFMFPLEIISHISRTLSLSIRLFGNILSTDLIVAIIFSLVPLFLPLPMATLSIITGLLQAYIFTILASLYIASAVEVQEFEQERRRLKQLKKKSKHSS